MSFLRTIVREEIQKEMDSFRREALGDIKALLNMVLEKHDEPTEEPMPHVIYASKPDLLAMIKLVVDELRSQGY